MCCLSSFLLIFFSLALLLSFISFFITGNNDQNIVNEIANRSVKAENWLGKFGAYLADFFLYKGFGVVKSWNWFKETPPPANNPSELL